VIEALKNARSKHPQGIFYFTRVGYPSAMYTKGLELNLFRNLSRWLN